MQFICHTDKDHKTIFRHLELDIASAIPAPKDEKYEKYAYCITCEWLDNVEVTHYLLHN